MRSDLNTTVEHAVMLARSRCSPNPSRSNSNRPPELPEVEHDSDQIHQGSLNSPPQRRTAMDGEGR